MAGNQAPNCQGEALSVMRLRASKSIMHLVEIAGVLLGSSLATADMLLPQRLPSDTVHFKKLCEPFMLRGGGGAMAG